MKKIFALALCAVMMLSVLAGCGGKSDAPADNTPAQNEPAATPDAAPDAAPRPAAPSACASTSLPTPS